MCVIIDACAAHLIFSQPRSDLAAPVWAWLERGGILIYGGQLAAELGKTASTRRLLVTLVRAGRAIIENQDELQREERRVVSTGECTSNDHHVVALARISGARVLCTMDRALMEDFGNPRLLRPKGRVYSRPEHARLLKHRPGCRGRRRR